MLSVLLLALSQRYVKHIKHIDVRRESKLSVAFEAIRFTKSPEFDLMCGAIGLKPDRMRSLNPTEAQKLFELITNKEESTNEFD